MKYILALDQGTTSCRAVIFDQNGKFIKIAQKEITQYYPQPGWVEHDAKEIWRSQLATLKEVVAAAGIQYSEIAGIGITNQRETTVMWDKHTGEPICNAIVWQDRRTAGICDKLKAKPKLAQYIQDNTGLIVDAYFSATKIRWILDNVPGAKQKAETGDLLFGTIDCWLIWKLTGGWLHATDYSNASRTMLYNIKTLAWDVDILEEMDIPASILPEVRPSSGLFDVTDAKILGIEIPITGVAGDQQAAMFGQACFEPGLAKNTYGTGCFLLQNTGNKPIFSKNGLISTIAWGDDSGVTYALEGSVFIAGAAIQWLKDGMKLIETVADSEYFASKVPDSDGVYVVPAFSGLAAPYWDMYAKGAIFGLSARTNKNHIIRATIESIAFRTKDVLDAMQADSKITLKALRVDGGASANNLLMQFQSDILGVEVQRSDNMESTARGAAFLAGIGARLWTKESVQDIWQSGVSFMPKMAKEKRAELYSGWQKAIKRTMGWDK